LTTVDSLLDRAPAFLLSFGDDGRIAYANATLLERLGWSREELIGKHVETLLTRAGRLFYQTHVFPLVKMHGRGEELFLIVEARDGEHIGTLWNLNRCIRDERAWIDCVVMEVRERRKYEDALLEAKRSAEAANVLLEEQAETLAEQAVELEAQQQQLMEQATELEVQTEALREANDELVEHTEALERERTAAQEARAAADLANGAKSDFLATMSHELRTPLNAIGGYVDLLSAGIYGSVNDEQRQALSRVKRSQRHLLGLINDILNLTRIEAGRIDYAISDLPLDTLVPELREMIDPQMAAKDLSFRVEVHGGIVLCADHEKTVQILLNLLSNAVKFTARDGTITLRSAPIAGDVGRIAIEVEDTGRGIPAAKLEAVFEPFVQVRSEPARANEGTGLGLAISRNLARGMGGDLSATSELGKGSTFRLTLPLVLASSGTASAAERLQKGIATEFKSITAEGGGGGGGDGEGGGGHKPHQTGSQPKTEKKKE
jgi:PAS domain S-box-containing protein